MKKPTKFDIAYESLGRVGAGAITDEAIAEIRSALQSSSGLLVARAAVIVAERQLQELIPDLAAAFERLMVNGAKLDKQCNAKIAITNALNKLEYMDDAVYLAGAKYVQMEAVWGGQADTAVDVRCNCAFGLARIGHRDVHYVLADLLVDPARSVRTAAAKALGYIGSLEGEVMLRLKVLTGDEPEVLSQCFTSLMTMAPQRSLEFVTRYLRSNDLSVAECAAITIGESRVEGAFDALRKCWEDDPSPTTRRMLTLPIALLRSDEAFEFLLGIVKTADNATASQAISALDLYADGESVRKVHEAVMSRGRR